MLCRYAANIGGALLAGQEGTEDRQRLNCRRPANLVLQVALRRKGTEFAQTDMRQAGYLNLSQ